MATETPFSRELFHWATAKKTAARPIEWAAIGCESLGKLVLRKAYVSPKAKVVSYFEIKLYPRH
ncbi:MAG: hypothetical protein AAFV69_04545 [Pseudomonadota bacterium]